MDFVWLPGARQALAKLRDWAPHLVIVTNQQGVGKGLMSADDLAAIHQQIQAELARDRVAIDAFQVCPHLESASCACRKPRPGLVVDWLAQNRQAEPSLSIMVGDSHSDLELARNVAAITGGCASIQIRGLDSRNGPADASFDSLWDFAVAVGHARGEQV
jgi:histidinol-phosphate phosphatase family protein